MSTESTSSAESSAEAPSSAGLGLPTPDEIEELHENRAAHEAEEQKRKEGLIDQPYLTPVDISNEHPSPYFTWELNGDGVPVAQPHQSILSEEGKEKQFHAWVECATAIRKHASNNITCARDYFHQNDHALGQKYMDEAYSQSMSFIDCVKQAQELQQEATEADMYTQADRQNMNTLYAMAEDLEGSLEYIRGVRSYVQEEANTAEPFPEEEAKTKAGFGQEL